MQAQHIGPSLPAAKLYASSLLDRRRARRGLLRAFAEYWATRARLETLGTTIDALYAGLACPRRPAVVHLARLSGELAQTQLEIHGWRTAIEAWAEVYRDAFTPLGVEHGF